MEDRYASTLLQDTRELVREIEDVHGREIQIVVDPARARSDGPAPLACTFEAGHAQIVLPSADFFPDSSVVHELLHIRRFLVDRVPQLVVCDDHWTQELEQGYTALDNDLEHLVIIPEEIRRRPERRIRWLDTVNRAIDRFEAARFIDIDEKRFSLRFSLLAHMLNDVELLARTRRLLELHELQEEFRNFQADLNAVLHSKREMCRVSVRYLSLRNFPSCLEIIAGENEGLQERI